MCPPFVHPNFSDWSTKFMKQIDIGSGMGRMLRILLRVLLVITTLIYPMFMDVMSAAGWQYNVSEGNYPKLFSTFAVWMFLGAGLLTIAAILCFLGIKPNRWQCNAAAIGCGCIGITACMIVLYSFCAYADQNFSGIDGTMQPVSELYRDRILPTILPFAILCVLSVRQLMSYDARVCRRQKRDAKRRADAQEAPKILGE